MTYVNNLKDIRFFLKGTFINDIKSFIQPKYYVHYLCRTDDTYKCLRIEEISNGLFGTRLFAKTRPIGGIDLLLENNTNSNSNLESYIDIKWLFINNDWFQSKVNNNLYAPALNDSDSLMVQNILLSYAVDFAKENNCKIIKRYVHQSLNEYNNELKDNGYILTDIKAHDNPYWIETYKII